MRIACFPRLSMGMLVSQILSVKEVEMETKLGN